MNLDPRVVLEGINMAPATVDEALVSLEAVSARLRAHGDSRAVFPDVYAIITRHVARSVHGQAPPLFYEPGWISRVAGRFAERYLFWLEASLAGRPMASTAWDVACGHASRRMTVPWQDALLGINAHVNYDLAQGMRAHIPASTTARDARMMARYRHDHDAINEILAASIDECLHLLVRRYGCRITAALTSTALSRALVCRWLLGMIEGWREEVWDELCALLAAPGPLAEARLLARIDARSGRVAWTLALGSAVADLGWPLVPARYRALFARAVRAQPAATAVAPPAAPAPPRVRPAAPSRAGAPREATAAQAS